MIELAATIIFLLITSAVLVVGTQAAPVIIVCLLAPLWLLVIVLTIGNILERTA